MTDLKKDAEAVEGYLKRDADTVDVAANVFTGGNEDETISSRSQRAAQRGNPIGKAVIWLLDKIQRNHGVLAEQGDLARAEKIVNVEENALKK